VQYAVLLVAIKRREQEAAIPDRFPPTSSLVLSPRLNAIRFGFCRLNALK
jgi:hypothetical protein